MTACGTVVSAQCIVKWDFLGKRYNLQLCDATAFAKQLRPPVNILPLIFTEVVLTRSTLIDYGDNKISHETSLWAEKGPFTTAEFLEMMNFSSITETTNPSWEIFMNKFKRS